jgi:hypothetical protein
MNKEHFIKGHDFNGLIDFKPSSAPSPEESLTNIVRPSRRKRSFLLPDEEENDTKLKETLNNLHRKFWAEN